MGKDEERLLLEQRSEGLRPEEGKEGRKGAWSPESQGGREEEGFLAVGMEKRNEAWPWTVSQEEDGMWRLLTRAGERGGEGVWPPMTRAESLLELGRKV